MQTTNLAQKGAGSSKGHYLDKTESPSIYVACLAAYNNGKYHGRWIDCTLGESHIWDEIQDILKTSPENTEDYPCEEWAIHDYEYFPSGLIGEYSSVEQVARLAEILEQDDGEAILALHSYLGNTDIDDTERHHADNYAGEWESMSDYAYDYCENTGLLNDVPDFIKHHIDYDSMGRDFEIEMIVCGKEKGRGFYVWYN